MSELNQIPRRIILGPGPSSAHPRVLKALSSPVMGYLDPDYFSIIEEVEDLLKKTFKTSQRAFSVAGSGSAGMEAGFSSLVEQGDKILICENGHFCERMILMAERLKLNVVTLKVKWGTAVEPDQLRKILKEHSDVKLVAAIHAETSTGVMNPIKELSAVAHENNALFMADCVTSLGGSELRFDDWDIDYAYSGSQKCLAAPPGLSPVAVSYRALSTIEKRETLPSSWYLDLSLIADYWSSNHRAHHTAPVNMIYGLRESLKLVFEEGLEIRWQRHNKFSKALKSGLKTMGLKLPINPKIALDQLTVIEIPDGINDEQFRSNLLRRYLIEIGKGLGQFQGKIWRVGLMGESCVSANVFALLQAFEQLLSESGFELKNGESLGEAARVLSETPPLPY
ncbi:MAG TPA: alanine--glyoxylate aminotransferase family protein [Dehalococcoidia bacterium]|jgi:alanine-glyoxylate transaminase/serine-glyoxylate transaminase/serine-pyruvate transaminase|nr:alanine--glyoxylate aminotransferase family protein [Dehalococcoidia bacterium]